MGRSESPAWRSGALGRTIVATYYRYNNASALYVSREAILAWFGAIADQSLIEAVEIDASLLCQTSFRSIWSDGKIRRHVLNHRASPIETPPFDGGARAFIAASLGSDSKTPDWLGSVRRATEVRTVDRKPGSGHYADQTTTEYLLELADGSKRRVFVQSKNYYKGYQFDAYDSLQELTADRDRVLDKLEDVQEKISGLRTFVWDCPRLAVALLEKIEAILHQPHV